MPYSEESLKALAAELFEAMDVRERPNLTLGEHLVTAETLLNLYKRMCSSQAQYAADNDLDFSHEGSLCVVRYAVEMHTALAAVKASL